MELVFSNYYQERLNRKDLYLWNIVENVMYAVKYIVLQIKIYRIEM